MATITWQRFNSAKKNRGDAWLRGIGSFPTNFRLILCDGTLDVNSSPATIIAAEISGFGYTRETITFGAAVQTVNSFTWTSPSIEISSSGGSLQFTHAVLWVDGIATPGDSTGYPEFIAAYPSTQTVGNGATYTIVVTWTET